MNTIESRYYDGTYLAENPDWDRKDSTWKADLVRAILSDFKILPSTVCEVGCGAGDILIHLRRYYPNAKFYGYDISPSVVLFWEQHNEEGGA